MRTIDASARPVILSTSPAWKEEICKEKSLLYFSDISLPRKQPWPDITGQPPNKQNNNKGQRWGKMGVQYHMHWLDLLIKRCLAAVWRSAIFWAPALTSVALTLKYGKGEKPGARDRLEQ